MLNAAQAMRNRKKIAHASINKTASTHTAHLIPQTPHQKKESRLRLPFQILLYSISYASYLPY